MSNPQRTGVIREYDMHSPSVRVGYGFILFLCGIMVIICSTTLPSRMAW